MEETSVCVMQATGSVVWEGKATSTPAALLGVLRRHAPTAMRAGLETGPLSTWLWHALRAAGVKVVCVDARHAQAALSMRINKTDRNDALGLAQLIRMGWYREVGAYLGLTSRRYASGEIDRMGRISRCGDPMIRSYLYEAANIMLVRARKANPLKSWGMKLAKRAGFKKARIALARKMAVVLHRMWRDATDFGASMVAA